MSKRLGIGTVQFGQPYGIANQGNCVSYNEAKTIIAHAWDQGIDTIDTAISYGESEQCLGDIGVAGWKIISKLPEIPSSCIDIGGWINDAVVASLKKLKIPCLYGLLLHRSQQLLLEQGSEIYSALLDLKRRGLVKKIGISIYGMDELDAVCPVYQFDIIQAPFNILDRRLVLSGWLPRLKKLGIEVHIRSVFLQGLLLMERSKLPMQFARWHILWQQLECWFLENQITPLHACIDFALSYPEIDRILVGVCSLKQLQEILLIKTSGLSFPPALISDDLDLINPSYWSIT